MASYEEANQMIVEGNHSVGEVADTLDRDVPDVVYIDSVLSGRDGTSGYRSGMETHHGSIITVTEDCLQTSKETAKRYEQWLNNKFSGPGIAGVLKHLGFRRADVDEMMTDDELRDYQDDVRESERAVFAMTAPLLLGGGFVMAESLPQSPEGAAGGGVVATMGLTGKVGGSYLEGKIERADHELRKGSVEDRIQRYSEYLIAQEPLF